MQDLLAFIERVGSHGLNPLDYNPLALRSAIAAGDSANLSRLSDESFVRIAHDLARGKLAADASAKRFGGLSAFDARALMKGALLRDDVMGSLDALAPQDFSYVSLRNALSSLSPAAPIEQRDALLATLERRRWMPRAPMGRHVVVNIPAYRLDLFDGDVLIESHRVIVGKKTTPTPQFPAAIEAVTLNPSWFVPDSIVKESVGALIRSNPAAARAKGYIWNRDSGGKLSVVQSPGDQNALGRVKFELPNPFHVYIHDTPSRELFDRSLRALSHGCIRVSEPGAFAATILERQGWDVAGIQKAIADGDTHTIALQTHVPVEIVYFTAEPTSDGSVRYWPDIYNIDKPLAERLAGPRREPKTSLIAQPSCSAPA